MRIAVYPGSFDPLHQGHLAIMRKLASMPEFDLTYLIVSPQSPFKESSKALNARERFDAAVEAVARHPELKVRVDDIELSMSAPHYTIRTLDALRAREPENEFTLIMGADNLKDILRWREAPRILREYGILAYPRQGFDLDALCAGLRALDPGYRIGILDAPLVNLSSTTIRTLQSHGEAVDTLLM